MKKFVVISVAALGLSECIRFRRAGDRVRLRCALRESSQQSERS